MWLTVRRGLGAFVVVLASLSSAHAVSATTGPQTASPVAYVVDWGGTNTCTLQCTFTSWGTLAAIDTGNGRRLHLSGRPRFGYGPPFSIAMAPGGVKAYVTAGEVTPVDLKTDRAYHSINFGSDVVPVDTAVAPDGRTLYVLTINDQGNGEVVPFNATTEARERSIKVGRYPQSIAVSPLSSWGLVVSGGAVQVFALETNRVVATIKVGGTPGEVAFSPNGLMAYVLDRGDVIPIDMSTLQAEPPIHVGGVLFGIGLGVIAISPDSATAYVSNDASNIVTCIDLVTARPSCSFRLPRDTGPSAMAVTPDGLQLFIVGGSSGAVDAIDLATHRVTSTVELSGAPGGIVIAP